MSTQEETRGSALIIGAKSDIAIALARKYASQGYSLILAARDLGGIEPIASDLRVRNPGAKVSTAEIDVLDTASHKGFYDTLPERPEVVVYVAGYMGEQEKAQKDFNETMKIIGTNYSGCVSLLNMAANEMEERGKGIIIGISSVAGDRGRKSNYIYGSAKGAMSEYLSGLRHRLAGKGVRVITVKPGFVRTRMTEGMQLPGALTAEPAQIARDVYKAHAKGKDVVYTLWYWRYIMLIIRHLPEWLFKRTNL